MIGIVGYRMGNLRSVQKGFERVGAEAVILSHPEEAARVDHLVLPGVGAFGDGMEHLRRFGFIEPIRAHIAAGKPFLGICLGMQLLFESSAEDAPSADEPVPGLGVLKGRVVLFDVNRGGQRIKVPHMGWNTLQWPAGFALFDGLEQGAAVYFVHGYYPEPAASNGRVTTAVAEYPAGAPFCAAIHRDNIWATQFHPEKSQGVGLRMLANFAIM